MNEMWSFIIGLLLGSFVTWACSLSIGMPDHNPIVAWPRVEPCTPPTGGSGIASTLLVPTLSEIHGMTSKELDVYCALSESEKSIFIRQMRENKKAAQEEREAKVV